MYIFLDESSFIYKFKHQISNLIIKINDNERYAYMLYASIFYNICINFTNLTHFHCHLNYECLYPLGSIINFPPTTYYSSSIVYLNLTVQTFFDCLYLLEDY